MADSTAIYAFLAAIGDVVSWSESCITGSVAFETGRSEESATAKVRRPLSRVAVLARIELCSPRLGGGGQGALRFDTFQYGEDENNCERWYRREGVLAGQMGAGETVVRSGRAAAESGSCVRTTNPAS
jgi:hypothetical protein